MIQNDIGVVITNFITKQQMKFDVLDKMLFDIDIIKKLKRPYSDYVRSIITEIDNIFITVIFNNINQNGMINMDRQKSNLVCFDENIYMFYPNNGEYVNFYIFKDEELECKFKLILADYNNFNLNYLRRYMNILILIKYFEFRYRNDPSLKIPDNFKQFMSGSCKNNVLINTLEDIHNKTIMKELVSRSNYYLTLNTMCDKLRTLCNQV